MEDKSLNLITPVPDSQLLSWLSEFYGKPVTIAKRQLLRHRDLSLVERLEIADSLPSTLIYKLVLPPWDIEQELHERILIPSITNSSQLYMTAHVGDLTAMFLEDLGEETLIGKGGTTELAERIGSDLAKIHRAYSYRIDELMGFNILPTLFPLDYVSFVSRLAQQLRQWKLIEPEQEKIFQEMSFVLSDKLKGEPISLVHGDLYAENLIIRHNKLFIIDWSWFTFLGVPTMDLATLTMPHVKNGTFVEFADVVLDSYSQESGRARADIDDALPACHALSRILFLFWLKKRRTMGIVGTTVGHVDELIPKVVDEILGMRL
ncbi:MAG: aminoglycoside phosphotransferase family protein [Candidatus Obscuribacterales bacterium]|nr:aminoglycoside phosphotransferase family protein [Candidatus Obscuribacterales bacterium]